MYFSSCSTLKDVGNIFNSLSPFFAGDLGTLDDDLLIRLDDIGEVRLRHLPPVHPEVGPVKGDLHASHVLHSEFARLGINIIHVLSIQIVRGCC